MGKEIGRGAYGRVFEVDYEGTLCAAKELHALLLQYAQGDNLRKIIDDFLKAVDILPAPVTEIFLIFYHHKNLDYFREKKKKKFLAKPRIEPRTPEL